MLDFSSLQIRVMTDKFSICQIADPIHIPFDDIFVFAAKTDNEISLVCRTSAVPEVCIKREDGWIALRMVGVLDLAIVGVISRISGLLAENNIAIFVVSTYNTDYILIREKTLPEAETALRDHGYDLIKGEMFPHWYKPESTEDTDAGDTLGAPRRNGFLRNK